MSESEALLAGAGGDFFVADFAGAAAGAAIAEPAAGVELAAGADFAGAVLGAGADFAAGAELAAGAAIVFAAGAELEPAIAESLFLLFFEAVFDEVLLEAASPEVDVEVFAAGAAVLVPAAAGAAVASFAAAAFFAFFDFFEVVVD
jgi:hypothetical protein